MAIVRKKLWKEYFDLMSTDEKKYEFRLNEFDIEVGDTLILEEWDPEVKTYTGRSIEKTVTSVSSFKLDDLPWSREEIDEKGFKIFSIK